MERSLRARVRCGDPAAFGVLFDDCARAVYNTAYRLTGNWSTAEKVVSLTFLQAWRHRGTVAAEGGSLRPWLLGICVNVTPPYPASPTTWPAASTTPRGLAPSGRR